MAKQFFLSIGRIPSSTAPFHVGKQIGMLLTSASQRNRMLSFIRTPTMTIPFTIMLIVEIW
jgi:hypothetical protein